LARFLENVVRRFRRRAFFAFYSAEGAALRWATKTREGNVGENEGERFRIFRRTERRGEKKAFL
jgi:hypothetical protein